MSTGLQIVLVKKGKEMAFLKRMFVLVFFFVLCSCMAQPISFDERARIKKVAVISLMGDDLFGLCAGLSPFGVSEQYMELKGFGFDRFVEETVTSALSTKGKYDFVRCDPEKTNIKNLYGSTKGFDTGNALLFKIEDVLPRLKGVAADSGVDTSDYHRERRNKAVIPRPYVPLCLWEFSRLPLCAW